MACADSRPIEGSSTRWRKYVCRPCGWKVETMERVLKQGPFPDPRKEKI